LQSVLRLERSSKYYGVCIHSLHVLEHIEVAVGELIAMMGAVT